MSFGFIGCVPALSVAERLPKDTRYAEASHWAESHGYKVIVVVMPDWSFRPHLYRENPKYG